MFKKREWIVFFFSFPFVNDCCDGMLYVYIYKKSQTLFLPSTQRTSKKERESE